MKTIEDYYGTFKRGLYSTLVPLSLAVQIHTAIPVYADGSELDEKEKHVAYCNTFNRFLEDQKGVYYALLELEKKRKSRDDYLVSADLEKSVTPDVIENEEFSIKLRELEILMNLTYGAFVEGCNNNEALTSGSE